MKVLITGGSGFLGKYLIPRLEACGHDCVLFAGDIRDKAEAAKYRLEKFDVVIHLAAQVHGKDGRRFHEVNAVGTENILKICQEIKPKIFIYLSSIRVLSVNQTPYSLSKKKAEEVIVESGLPYIILRPSLLYGRGDEKNLGFFFKLITRWPILPIFDFKVQPLFVGDLVEIICRSMESRTNQTVNLAGRETIALSDVLEKAKPWLNRHTYILSIPKFLAWPLKLISSFPGFPFPWWQIQPLLSNEIFKGDPWPELFNIKPTRLDDGLKHALK